MPKSAKTIRSQKDGVLNLQITISILHSEILMFSKRYESSEVDRRTSLLSTCALGDSVVYKE